MKHVVCAHVALEVLYGPLSAAIVAFPHGFDEFGFDVIYYDCNRQRKIISGLWCMHASMDISSTVATLCETTASRKFRLDCENGWSDVNQIKKAVFYDGNFFSKNQFLVNKVCIERG